MVDLLQSPDPTRPNHYVINLDGTQGYVPFTDAEIAQQADDQQASADAVAAQNMQRKVSAAQAKLALYNAGLLDQVKDAVAQYVPYQIFYDSASEWQRNHPYVIGLGQELSLADEQIDALFDQASQL